MPSGVETVPLNWITDLKLHQSVQEYYKSLKIYDDKFQDGQLALYAKMCELFNPSGFLPIPKCLQHALEKADEFRTRNYYEECRIFWNDVKSGRCLPNYKPPTVWSDDHHSNIVRCIFKQYAYGHPNVMLFRLQRALIDAEQKAIGGITEEDVNIALEIELEITSCSICI